MTQEMNDTQEMRKLKIAVTGSKTALCPTCGESTEFVLSGQQSWPAHVAKALDLPEVINVWHCLSCDTTLLEPNLTFDD